MARFSGATVLLMLVTTVSAYTCAIIAGAALGRPLDRSGTTKLTPSDRALRVSVSFRGLAKDFAKELWEGRSGRAVANRAATMLPDANERELRNRTTQVNSRTRDDIHTGEASNPWSVHNNLFYEITDERSQGGRGVMKVGPWEGPGVKTFYMRRGRGVSAPIMRSVILSSDDAIHTFHQCSQGEVVLKRTQQPVRRGSVPVTTTIDFASDEQLIAVEGTYGHCSYVSIMVVTSLTFRTDKGKTYGPYGKETGSPFSIQAANGCIVGFWGRSDWLLDAIGVYIRPCQAHKAAS